MEKDTQSIGNTGIKIKLYDSATEPPTSIGYYIGVIKVGNTVIDSYKVYWNGDKFVQEEWQAVKVIKYLKIEDLIIKSR